MKNESSEILRISFASHENFRVIDEYQRSFPAKMAGKIRLSDLWPTVGDWVKGILQPGDWVQITEILPRNTTLSRKDPGQVRPQILAANVDTLLAVTSANQDLSPERLERYVALAFAGGIKPVILINKIELADDAEALLKKIKERFPSISVLGVSVYEGINLEALSCLAVRGQTLVLAGSSGVGKSTLTNYLLGNSTIATQEIREEDSRGRHTTTYRELHLTPSGAALIDTPGIRQVGLTGLTDLSKTFSPIEELAQGCRFRDCLHEKEPGCRVQQALADGTLSQDQWDNYVKLGKELAYEKRKTDKALQAEEKKKWIKIHKAHRQRKRFSD